MPRTPHEMTSRFPLLVLAYAHSRGLDVPALLKRHELPSDLDPKSAGKAEVTLPVAKVTALLEELAATLGAPHLGLDVARSVQAGAYGVAEFLIRSATNAREACANLVRFSALMSPDLVFRFDESGPEAVIEHHMPGSVDSFSRHHHEYTMFMVAGRFTALVEGATLTRMWFMSSRPADLSALRAAFGEVAFGFDHPVNGFAFDKRLLDAPVKTGDAALFAFLEEHALAALASRPKTDDLIERLRQGIRDALKQGEPNIERIATRLALSGRTLQRRLSEFGTSFQVVLDEVRFDLARAYLRDVRLDITQVAYLLGYSELRAFDRAFKRWAKVTPRDWREQATHPGA